MVIPRGATLILAALLALPAARAVATPQRSPASTHASSMHTMKPNRWPSHEIARDRWNADCRPGSADGRGSRIARG